MKLQVNPTEEFNRIYSLYSPHILGFTLKLVGNIYVAEGITTDVFIKVWERLIAFIPIPNEPAFLYTIARNKSLDYLKFNKRQNENKKRYEYYINCELHTPFEDEGWTNEHYKIMYRSIDQLPPYLNRVMVLVLEGSKDEEIANRLNIKLESVRQFKWMSLGIIRGLVHEKYYRLLLK